MTRRRLLTSALAALGAALVPRALVPDVEPHTLGSFGPPPRVIDSQTGISIRFVREYDIKFHPNAFALVAAPLADFVPVSVMDIEEVRFSLSDAMPAFEQRPVPDPIFLPTAASTQEKRT